MTIAAYGLNLTEADSAFPSRNVRPVDAHRVESAAGEDVSEHRCYGGLPARANHRYEPVGRKRAREGLCAVGHGDAERLRLREAGVRVLDGGRDDHLVRRLVDSASVVGEALHADGLEEADVLRAESTISAGHLVSEPDQRGREGAHSDAPDSDEVALH